MDSLLRVVCAVVYTVLALWLVVAVSQVGWLLWLVGAVLLVVVVSANRLWLAVVAGLWLGLH